MGEHVADTARAGAPDGSSMGIASLLVATVLFAVTDAIAKWLGGEGIHAAQIVFHRYSFGLIPVIVAIAVVRGRGLRTRRPIAHIVRGLLMCSTLLLFFWGLRYVPLAEAIAVAFTAPLFITVLSIPMLGEKVGPHRWAAVGVGFLGMLVILRPGFAAFQPEMLFIVASAVMFAIAVLYTRRITATETNAAIFTYTTMIAAIAMSPFAAMTWHPPTEFELALLFVIGMIGGAAHFLVIVAYRHTAAAVNATLEYFALLWAIVIGWYVWSEVPDLWVLAGALVVAAAGVYITRREIRVGARRRT